MPGILPMKVIKIGTQAQARIAQACDRCRSKKIRCDGIRPSCSQCVNVGFECKTSDKLSRRAFPRGYTESLEERVRSLEAEVRELKALLDEKDENIDVLSRIHSHSSQPRRSSFVATPASPESAEQEKDEVFKVMQAPILLDGDNTTYFMGASSGRSLIDTFRMRLQDAGRSGQNINSNAFFATNPSPCGHAQTENISWTAPARLVSDQLINIFFQEWAPLFPILHRPTFLSIYGDYVSCPESMEDKHSLAQLHLVFSIAAHSSNASFDQEVESFDAQWKAALDQISMDSSLATLQALLLAQICCQQKGDHLLVLKYKGLAISLSQRLGLHQAQKRFALGALTSETRKKVFWTMYTLDCFTAAQLGLPRMMKDEDAQCEYPVDADDEYITEKGFLPTLPGEFTKLSSALALFKASRILAKVLSEVYPSSASYELSFRKLDALSDELDEWHNSLPTHLRLQFLQDKPSTNVISSRSPLLSLNYHYIRSLIYRPVVCASSTIRDRAGSATVSLATSSKHIVQIIELLEERSLAFTFCLNKSDLMVLSGFGILFQSLARDDIASLNRNNQKLIHSIAEVLEQAPSPTSWEFRRIANTLAPRIEDSPPPRKSPLLSRHNSDGQLNSTQDAMSSTQKHIRSIMSRFSPSKPNKLTNDRRATVPAITLDQRYSTSQVSISSANSEPALVTRSEPTLSPHIHRSSLSAKSRKSNASHRATMNASSTTPQVPNLDYLPLGVNAVSAYQLGKSAVNPTDWERLLSSMDNGQVNIYDEIYGSAQHQIASSTTDLAAFPLNQSSPDLPLAWSPDIWAIDPTNQPAPQSVLSFSDESLTSGEDFADLTTNGENYRGIMIPEMSPCSVDGLNGLGSLDGGFGL